MAQEVEFGTGGIGKIRSFWVGLGLSIVTLSIYSFCWYYFVNDEVKDIGIDKGDQNLAQSSPAASVAALLLGSNIFVLFVPYFLSVYNYGKRIQRAQRLGDIPKEKQINPTTAFLLLFPGAILIIPLFLHYWYLTKHQNIAVRAAGGLDPYGEIEQTTAPEIAESAPEKTA
jgi:Domain of unknown function (DUF4234)